MLNAILKLIKIRHEQKPDGEREHRSPGDVIGREFDAMVDAISRLTSGRSHPKNERRKE